MNITKKVMIIIISITLTTVALSICASQSILKNLCSGEATRSIGRTVSVLTQFDSIMNEFEDNSEQISQLIQLSLNDNETSDINKADEQKKQKLIDRISKNKYSNFYVVDENYNITSKLKEHYNYNDNEIYRILNTVEKNTDKHDFNGIVSTDDYQYMVCVKPILTYISGGSYLVIIEPFSGDIYKESENFSGSVFIKKISLNDLKSFNKIKVNDRIIFNRYTDDLVTSYTKVDSYGGSDNVYISLEEKSMVVQNVKMNLYKFIAIIIIIFVLANFIIYFSIKTVIVDRMLKINIAVNKIINTFDLKTRILADNRQDEISILSSDLNSMFSILEQYSEKMKYISGHDTVTRLLNRRSLEEIGENLIRDNKEFSCAFIDIDNFKKINDFFGHNTGDEVLCIIADYLMAYGKDKISCGRIGGDEFLVIIEGEGNKEKIIDMVKYMFDKLKDNIYFRGTSYNVKASIGISYFPEHGETFSQILQNSDIAMYNVKNNERNNYCIFQRELFNSLEVESKILEGIKKGEFEAYFQPIIDLKTGIINGAEALIRWNTCEGVISPNKFIPLAKSNGYIIEIDKMVIEQSCKLIRELIDNGIEDFQISINTSFKLLSQKRFLSNLMEVIRRYNIGVKNIKLEITEDETIEDLEYMTDLLRRIRECGIQVSIDDFGTGYSSFNYIKTLPLDVLKIDKSLLRDMEKDERTKHIIKTIINLAHILNLSVTCEGVETKEQFQLLEKLNCDNIQGYYLSRPLKINDFKAFISMYVSN
ncbi:putative bifunctional diguanylate cyclase/phosphodiesterase [Clostridium butyricum]